MEWLWREDNDKHEPFPIERLVGESDGPRRRCNRHAVDVEFNPTYIPHIVPPTWDKWMGDYTLRHIWREAYRVLAQCERLFIIGTSLPSTDSHIRHLIRLAYHNKGANCKMLALQPALLDRSMCRFVFLG